MQARWAKCTLYVRVRVNANGESMNRSVSIESVCQLLLQTVVGEWFVERESQLFHAYGGEGAMI